MATCADCIHYEVCSDYFDATIECGSTCSFLKDRSRFVESPRTLRLCDEVYFVLRGLDEIDLKEYKFTVGNSAVSDTVQFVTEIGTYGFWVGDSPREFAPDYDDFYHWYEFGKTVFLTREEAERALKRR